LAPGTPFVIGTAVVVPRRPTILSYDAATEAQALDRLRCAGRTDGDSWEQAIELEAKRIFAAMISNDPRPHYFHQSNLIGAGDGRGAPALLFGLRTRCCAVTDAVWRRTCRSRSRRSPTSEGCC
jgi:hypothetical protein